MEYSSFRKNLSNRSYNIDYAKAKYYRDIKTSNVKREERAKNIHDLSNAFYDYQSKILGFMDIMGKNRKFQIFRMIYDDTIKALHTQLGQIDMSLPSDWFSPDKLARAILKQDDQAGGGGQNKAKDALDKAFEKMVQLHSQIDIVVRNRLKRKFHDYQTEIMNFLRIIKKEQVFYPSQHMDTLFDCTASKKRWQYTNHYRCSQHIFERGRFLQSNP